MSKILQYELWRECNCKCTFCTLGEDNEFTKDELKLQSLQTAIDEIKSLKKDEHEVVGFIGGEFFQGQLNTPEIKDKFFELIKVTNDCLNEGKIKTIWINASLLIGKQKDFYDTLDLIDNKKNLWILTSFDIFGRFHTPKMLETWEYHMDKIHTEYPDVNLNTTSILTGTFVQAYLGDKIDLIKFREKYHTSVFFKNPVKPHFYSQLSNAEINEKLGYFFPKRSDFLAFLKKYLEKEDIAEYDKLISTELRADEVRKNYNEDTRRNIRFLRDTKTLHETELDGIEDVDLSCGHNDIYASYCDSDKCILCDKTLVRKYRL